MRDLFRLTAVVLVIALAACGDKAESDPTAAALNNAKTQKVVTGGGLATTLPATTGSMSSGTPNSDTATGAPPPGAAGPGNAH